jgi:hypothetical protein
MRRAHLYVALLALLAALLAAQWLPGVAARSARSHAAMAAEHARMAAEESAESVKAAAGDLNDTSTGMWRSIINKLTGQVRVAPVPRSGPGAHAPVCMLWPVHLNAPALWNNRPAMRTVRTRALLIAQSSLSLLTLCRWARPLNMRRRSA